MPQPERQNKTHDCGNLSYFGWCFDFWVTTTFCCLPSLPFIHSFIHFTESHSNHCSSFSSNLVTHSKTGWWTCLFSHLPFRFPERAGFTAVSPARFLYPQNPSRLLARRDRRPSTVSLSLPDYLSINSKPTWLQSSPPLKQLNSFRPCAGWYTATLPQN